MPTPRILLVTEQRGNPSRAELSFEIIRTVHLSGASASEISAAVVRSEADFVLIPTRTLLGILPRSATVSTDSPEPLGLTHREKAVLALLCKGQTNAAIARSIHASTRTVKRILTEMYVKLAVANRTELVARVSSFNLSERVTEPI
jgi:DNA-binding NarL/FixJ family response regulator